MSAHCEKCGIELGLELDCWACDLRAERDRYREALERIIAIDSGDQPEPLVDIAREAL